MKKIVKSDKLTGVLNIISSMKLALVYDRVNKLGGAERVLQALHQIFKLF